MQDRHGLQNDEVKISKDSVIQSLRFVGSPDDFDEIAALWQKTDILQQLPVTVSCQHFYRGFSLVLTSAA